MNAPVFFFPDIETTGLDPENDKILEVAWAFTDDQFRPLHSHPQRSFVIDHGFAWGDVYAQIRANDIVRDMHQKSGLIFDIQSSEASWRLFEIADILFDDIGKLPRDVDVKAAGFSVDFDLRFLRARHDFFGLFDEGGDLALHYQQLNLSSIKLMLDSAGIEYPKPPKAHRALADVRQGITFARKILLDVKALGEVAMPNG